MPDQTNHVPVAVGVVDGGIGINFGYRHGLQDQEHRRFLRTLLLKAGFSLPETVRFQRNKQAADGKIYVDWMRLRIPSDECQVNEVNPSQAVLNLRQYLASDAVLEDFGVAFEVA